MRSLVSRALTVIPAVVLVVVVVFVFASAFLDKDVPSGPHPCPAGVEGCL